MRPCRGRSTQRPPDAPTATPRAKLGPATPGQRTPCVETGLQRGAGKPRSMASGAHRACVRMRRPGPDPIPCQHLATPLGSPPLTLRQVPPFAPAQPRCMQWHASPLDTHLRLWYIATWLHDVLPTCCRHGPGVCRGPPPSSHPAHSGPSLRGSQVGLPSGRARGRAAPRPLAQRRARPHAPPRVRGPQSPLGAARARRVARVAARGAQVAVGECARGALPEAGLHLHVGVARDRRAACASSTGL